ncbi:MAG: phosphate acyltransferase PlsX [Gemmatimonadaceae bacterium]|nr:phosphate acyltransferase PlsX [Gemmatimonadaceae bacterium]
MPRIALDAMGGDYAPAATVAGALLALAELPADASLQMVGKEDVLVAELERQGHASVLGNGRIEIVGATQVIEMNDKPSVAAKGKRDSSMVVGLRLQTEGRSDAFVSAGNTGAQMAASVFVLRLHEGLSRPAISTLLPTGRGVPLVMLDSGANVDCSPEELVQFARLGAVYAEDILRRANPAVGLLSVGEEPEKGNLAVKEAHRLLAQSGLNFIGNVEGRDLPRGACARGDLDVVVCDGFTGNVILKFYEAVAPMIFGLLAQHGAPRSAVDAVKHAFDYAQYGGAPLLGVKGISIICHGQSSAEAIKNAIKVAALAIDRGMAAHIGRSVRSAPQEARP